MFHGLLISVEFSIGTGSQSSQGKCQCTALIVDGKYLLAFISYQKPFCIIVRCATTICGHNKTFACVKHSYGRHKRTSSKRVTSAQFSNFLWFRTFLQNAVSV